MSEGCSIANMESPSRPRPYPLLTVSSLVVPWLGVTANYCTD